VVTLGTPSNDDVSADISGVLQVARDRIGAVIDEYTVVASKSTVPVGTGDRIEQAIAASGVDTAPSAWSAIPNFKEGAAVDDFMRPSRITSARMRRRPAGCTAP
jgi:UDPglucose 6-dehydrogenase